MATYNQLDSVDAAPAAAGPHVVSSSSRTYGDVWDGELRIWKVALANGEPILKTVCAVHSPASVASSIWIDANTIASGGDDGVVRWYYFDEMDQALVKKQELRVHSGVISKIDYSHDAKPVNHIMSCGYDSSIHLIDVHAATRIWSVNPMVINNNQRGGIIHDGKWSLNRNDSLATAVQNSKVCLYDIRAFSQNQAPSSLVRLGHCGYSLEWLSETTIMCGCDGGMVSLLDIRSFKVPVKTARVASKGIHSLERISSYSKNTNSNTDGSVVVACGSDDGRVVMIDAGGLETIQDVYRHKDYVRGLALVVSSQQAKDNKESFGSSILISSSWDSTMRAHRIMI